MSGQDDFHSFSIVSGLPGQFLRSDCESQRQLFFKIIRHFADVETTSSRTESSEDRDSPGWGDSLKSFSLRPFSQEGLRVMSHDDAASRRGREASRRRVNFQVTMEDLEGRVMMS